MKSFFSLVIAATLILVSCTKSPHTDIEKENQELVLQNMPDSQFKGNALYGIWEIDSIKALSGFYIKGDKNVQIAFTNSGEIYIVNQEKIALNHVDGYAST
ncbi:MAG TPA: hypothetical protein PK191_03085 [Niabella sp.]|nr:hypothetical protein [Niabella sp.]HOZ96138.1 hypothetical protein [Niabella sp.]HQW13504.1 hypothetical protein [Niabella sp.]HQX18898.1 hypothetical protein [Niabella sp.]HQX41814.1 hypothetical protein [Niabella sp.]